MASGSFSGGKERAFGRGVTDAARAAVDDCLAVRAGERMVVVTEPDPDVARLAMAVHDAAERAGAEVLLMAQRPRGQDDLADPGVIRVLETDPDVVAVLTRGALGADPERIARPIHGTYTHYFHYLIGEGRARGFWAPGVSRRDFARAVAVDRPAMQADGEALQDVLLDAVELRVTSDAGTDLVVPIQGDPSLEVGDYRKPGQGGELPAGVLRAPAEEGLASGRLVLDAAVGLPEGTSVPRRPVVLDVKAGKVEKAQGGAAADALEKVFASAPALAERAVAGGWLTREQAAVYAANARRVIEVGIGLNPLARLGSDLLVATKVHGAVTVRLGAASHELPPGAPVHVDGVLKRPTVVAVLADGTEHVLVQKGQLRPPVAVAQRS